MSEFIRALRQQISNEIAAKPASTRGIITSVDYKSRTCEVRFPNPAGVGDVTTTALFPKTANGISGGMPKVGQLVTVNLLQGSLSFPSITELRYKEDNPLHSEEIKEQSVKRTGTTAIRALSARKING